MNKNHVPIIIESSPNNAPINFNFIKLKNKDNAATDHENKIIIAAASANDSIVILRDQVIYN